MREGMSTRTTLIALFALLVFCGGGLYLFTSVLSRDAQMRDAEREFRIANGDRIGRIVSKAEKLRLAQQQQQDTAEEPASSSDLDAWNAEAGTADEVFDPTPEDDTYLIQDAEPTSDAAPVDSWRDVE